MRWWRRLSARRRMIAACLGLFAVYGALSFAMDPHAFLGTDTGGKVATLRAMDASGDLVPDIGYWAEEWDPDGSVHPLFYTFDRGGHWVNVTTLPMLYAAYPLWQIGGYRLALLVPMAGAVAAALAARALARRVSAGDGWAAFWVVGLASPLTIYALDFWEHSAGVALGAWAIVLLIDQARDGGSVRALAAGALFGLAATMRTEAFAYGAAAVGVACLFVLWRRRSITEPIVAGLAATAGFAVPVLANSAVEEAILGVSLRAERAVGTVTAGATEGASRLSEAAATGVNHHSAVGARYYLLGALAAVLLGFVAFRAVRRPADIGPLVLALGSAAALYVVRFDEGFGFIPGMTAAAPLVPAGVVLAWRRPASRVAMAAVLLALPLVWAFQFTGGALPQWGGRYILLTGLVGTAVGVGLLEPAPRQIRYALYGFAVVVTAFGLAWMGERTHQVGDAARALADRPEPALVSRIGHLFREAGDYYGDDRWLTAVTDEEQAEAVEVLEAAGIDEFGIVAFPGQEIDAIPGWRRSGEDAVALFDDVDLPVITFVRAGGG